MGDDRLTDEFNGHISHQPGELLAAWANLEWRGLGFVTLSGRLIWGNDSAHSMLRETSDFRLGSGSVVFGDLTNRDGFSAFLEASSSRNSSWFYRRPNGGEPLLFGAVRLVEQGPEPLVALSFHAVGSSFPMAWAEFGHAFRLTPSEHRVVLRLLEGDGAESTAALLGVSVETVRTHIRRAYVKINVGSREQLFRVLAPFRY